MASSNISNGDSSKQIKQMVNFIMQEANEKVNEIRIKTDHDFNLEKQNLVHAGKLKVQEEYAQKLKDLEVEQKVSRSTAIGAARIKLMKARDDLLEVLKEETLEKLAKFSKNPKYEDYLKSTIIQGLIKIEEETVELHIRPEDETLVKKVLPIAIAEYKLAMAQAGKSAKPNVTISNNKLPSKMSNGGLVISALNGRIVVNQTVDERLLIAYTDMMPAVRHGLFSTST